MNFEKSLARLVLGLMLAIAACAFGEDSDNSNRYERFRSGVQAMKTLTFTTPAYRQQALRFMVEEANRVAQELRLPENLPITESGLIAKYVTAPRIAQRLQAIGSITTSNHTYYFSVGNKFSYLVRQNLEKEYFRLGNEYLWPMSQLDTNAAYRSATQLLAAASIDVDALNRDCKVRIQAFTPEGKAGKHFVPVYWVYWVAPGQEGRGNTASIELLLPTKTILQMYVNNSEYILRKPLEITNLDFLLSLTNALALTNTPARQ